MRAFRAVLGLLFAGFLLVAAAAPVAADVRDVDQGIGLPFFPCLPGAAIGSYPNSAGSTDNDGTFARICFVNLFGTGWQARTGERILFRVAWVTQTEAQCEQFLANATVTEQFQGTAVTPDVLPCQQRPGGSEWVTVSVFVTRPLPPGTYTNTFTFAINADITDGLFDYPAGTVLAFPPKSVQVMPGG